MKHNTDYLITNSQPPPFFGAHPVFVRRYKKNSGSLFDVYLKESVQLKQFFSELHPEIYLLPRDSLGEIRDEYGGSVGLGRINFPFSSYDFFIDEDADGVFEYIKSLPSFFRLGSISQLCYLAPPRPNDNKDMSFWYYAPLFPHTRWLHSLLAGVLAEVILARNDFSIKERTPIVLAAAFHDIAMPAGGDSIVRIDKENLHEENNFLWLLEHAGIIEELKERFCFNASEAASWVRGQEMPGKLIDIVDKMSYVAIDCYHVGMCNQGLIREYCQHYPLIMDVWQDVRIDKETQQIYFVDAKRLYRFLLLRAYEHSEFLLNPYSRALDFYLTKMTKVLYDKGLISCEDLLTQDNAWLERQLEREFPKTFKTIICPDQLCWQKFTTKEDQLAFAEKIGDRLDHLDDIKGFNAGLDWLVKSGNKIIPLNHVINQNMIEKMQSIVESTKGYFVYYNAVIKQ
jgi:hypothetical protein